MPAVTLLSVSPFFFLKSQKYSVRILARLCSTDNRTVLARTLATIDRECGCEVDKLRAAVIKSKMSYFAVPPETVEDLMSYSATN